MKKLNNVECTIIQFGILTGETMENEAELYYDGQEFSIYLIGEFSSFRDTESTYHLMVNIKKSNKHYFYLDLIADSSLEEFTIIKNSQYNKFNTFLLYNKLTDDIVEPEQNNKNIRSKI